MNAKEILDELRKRLETKIEEAFESRDANRGGGLCEASEMIKEFASELGITGDFESSFVD